MSPRLTALAMTVPSRVINGPGGTADVAIGAERAMGFQGRVMVFRWSAAGLVAPLVVDRPTAGARFGFSLAAGSGRRRGG